MLSRQHADDHGDIGSGLEGLNAVQEHRLSGDPTKLLQLFRSGARPAASGDDDDTDVALHLSVEKLSKEVVDCADTNHLYAARSAPGNSPLRHIRSCHPHFCRLAESALRLRNRSDFAAKPDFAEKNCGVG